MLAEIPRKGPAPCPGAVEVPSESQPSARALVRVPMAGVDLGPIGPSAPESQIGRQLGISICHDTPLIFFKFNKETA